MVAIRGEFSGISRVETHRGSGLVVPHDLGVGFAASVDVCAAFPSTRLEPFRLFLFSHASVGDYYSVLFRPSYTALFVADTPKHLTNR